MRFSGATLIATMAAMAMAAPLTKRECGGDLLPCPAGLVTSILTPGQTDGSAVAVDVGLDVDLDVNVDVAAIVDVFVSVTATVVDVKANIDADLALIGMHQPTPPTNP